MNTSCRILIPFIIFILFSSSGGAVMLPNLTSDNFKAIQYYNNAVDEANAGRYEVAVNLTSQALAIQPNFTLAQVTRAGSLMELGRMDEAGITLENALNISPDNPTLLTSTASYYLKKGDNQKAASFAGRAAALNPSLVEAWIIKGTAHGELGDYQEELNASEHALQVDPNSTLALTNKAYATDMLKPKQKSPSSLVIPIIALSALALLATRKCE